jgi:hypothetical protein
MFTKGTSGSPRHIALGSRKPFDRTPPDPSATPPRTQTLVINSEAPSGAIPPHRRHFVCKPLFTKYLYKKMPSRPASPIRPPRHAKAPVLALLTRKNNVVPPCFCSTPEHQNLARTLTSTVAGVVGSPCEVIGQ